MNEGLEFGQVQEESERSQLGWRLRHEAKSQNSRWSGCLKRTAVADVTREFGVSGVVAGHVEVHATKEDGDPEEVAGGEHIEGREPACASVATPPRSPPSQCKMAHQSNINIIFE